MAIGFPVKANYASGDILTAAQMNDLSGTLNYMDPTAKGDLFPASSGTALTRLAVGNNGETLLADSSTSTGLRYQGSMAAGKNAVINGGMDIWQRGTSFIGTGYNYCADRFICFRAGFAAGMTVTRQTSAQTGFQYAMRIARDSGNTGTGGLTVNMGLETVDSIPFAGQTVTLSYYARVGANYSGGTSFTATLYGGTGTDQAPTNMGGWTGATALGGTTPTLTTTFQRFTTAISVGSSFTQLGISTNWTPTGTAGANDWVEITGIQIEVGSVATTFRRSGGTIQGELGACQRYYWRQTPGVAYGMYGWASPASTTACNVAIPLPVQMRVTPTAVEVGNLQLSTAAGTTFAISSPTMSIIATPNLGSFDVTSSGMTANSLLYIRNANNTAGFLGFTAEL